ncbi:urease accessory protein UreD [Rhodococcus sp. IEGM 1379]|uniref:urease accessory protein UreD n=1 Tax=Rhodococcus sp. IEGM 1379 TaxID=3047086 RepID=UPI0024B65259|nr:urease accessory protein UreD [Rhodococcus sp. IEGM 1379]MDI9915007.1 urease accessory protein UreD [Rhodococcus sp. IEGM 1379]
MNTSAPVSGATRIVVERTGDTATAAELISGDFLAPRFVSSHGRHVRIALVGHSATLLAGDDLRIEFDVAPGTFLEVIEPSGTVAYNARGGHASWTATARVGAGGALVWRAAPFVVAGGANVSRRIDISLETDAIALLDEMVVLGRTGEIGGALRSDQRITVDGTPLLVETLDLRSVSGRSLPGVLGGHRVLGTTMLLGMKTAETVDRHVTPLSGPGMLARALTDHAHEATAALEEICADWYATVARRYSVV